MATPTITSITPSSGWTGGGSVVEIRGSGFKLIPPYTGPAPGPKPADTVKVTFGGVPAKKVMVASATLIRCIPPRHEPNRWVYRFADGKEVPALRGDGTPPEGATLEQVAEGTVDVVVANLQNGSVIPGESVTAAGGFTFRRPRLDRAGTWLRTVDAFIDELQVVFLENVVWSPNVDYDPDTGDVTGLVGLAEIPGIALMQLSFPDGKDQRASEQTAVNSEDGQHVLLRRPPVFSDMECNLVAVSDDDAELFTLAQAMRVYFKNTEGLVLARDPDGGDHGTVLFRYFADPRGVQMSGRLGRTNMMTATLAVALRSIPIDAVPGVEQAPLPGEPAWIGHEGVVGVTRRLQHVRIRATRFRP